MLYGDFDPDRVAAMYETLIGSDERTTRILAGLDGETAQGVAPEELSRYEAKAHAVITDLGATAVCLFDMSSLPAAFEDVNARRHGLLVEDGAVRRNERFEYQPA